MSTNHVPLRLSLDPGEYECVAHLPASDGQDQPVPGRLALQPDQPPTIAVHGDLDFVVDHEHVGSAYFPQSTTRPTILVDLVRGDTVVLLDCTIQVIFPGRALVTAAAAIIRGAMPTTDTYTCTGLTMQVTGSDAVIGPPPINKLDMPRGNSEPGKPLFWSVEERLPRRISAEDDGATVSGSRVTGWSPPTGWSYHISFSPVIDIELRDPVDLATLVDQWVEPLRRIVSLATGRSERITWLQVWGVHEPARPAPPDADPKPSARQVFGAGIGQNPFASDDNEVRTTKLGFWAWGQNMPSLLALCRAWQAAERTRHPLIETLGNLLFLPELHPRPRYLLFVQALEGLHGYDHAAERRERQLRHTERYNAAMMDVEAVGGVASATRRFLKRNLMRKPIESLEPALREVVNALPRDLSSRFADLDLVADALDAEGDPLKDWPSVLRVVRNGLSHGTGSWPREHLEEAAELLEVVARAHMMRLIGCSDEAVGAWLDR